MEAILDQSFSEFNEESKITYAGFWPRLWALLIDSLLLMAISVPVFFFNILSWKSVPLMVFVSLITLAYKPFMENNYGATLGKMALRLKVLNYEYKSPVLKEVLLRNVFTLGLGFISIIISFMVFTAPGFEDISSWTDYAVFSQNYGSSNWVNYLSLLIYLIEMIVLLNDKQKRSLHDMIGRTYVVRN